ncbi:hypothetical protein [Paenarthrobacter nitroguajacolicus]|uniref:hypothetical protein n=1 Tax=Paenarthrobacter nitroguajacolicus TaxID=211146 RepID=UPI00248C5573|nr:hypothetical protein [Paenarthrobacter nitroguajacolicus]MDI2033002.1 hypothetical protein [Paenarthrobacter nitroguajacolicus]
MAITAADIKIRLSVTSGSAGNTSTSSGPASLGKYVSTTDVPTGTNQFFNQVTGTENAGSVTKYRCFFVYNAHATLTLMNAVVWLQGGDPAGGTAVTLAVDSTPASAVGSASAQALTAASETAPGAPVTGLAYSAPSTSDAGLSLGNIGPGQVRAVWMKQAAQNSTAVTEAVTLAVTGSTLA